MVAYEELLIKDVSSLGSGTFGHVDLAWSDAKHEYFAQKKFNINDVVQENRVEYVKREKDVLQLCSSPFIVKLICTGMDKFSLFLVMEFAHGGELRDYLYDMSEKELLEAVRFYVTEVVCALKHIHSKSVVYRDLKPENLLLSKEGHVKLTDFGLAKVLKGKTYTICGTAEYIAPEVFLRKGYGVDVDWWSLGVLIFELLNGSPPFTGDSEEAVIEAVKQHSISYPSSFDKSTRELIESLISNDPARRGENISNRSWFATVDWGKAGNFGVQPPIVPASLDVSSLSPPSIDRGTESPQRARDLFEDWNTV
ncbi:hypothetical protein Q1695_015291 [Nippostrongylus brasiliensis]|nr:hypothetical protein Q1695_015291 [Nippostrongylus brasiliensis]